MLQRIIVSISGVVRRPHRVRVKLLTVGIVGGRATREAYTLAEAFETNPRSIWGYVKDSRV